MRKHRRLTRAIAAMMGLALLAAACGDDDDDAGGSASGTTVKPSEIPKGGTITIGAEQEPACSDWIHTCAGSSWGAWIFQYQTMPRAFDVSVDNGVHSYKASSLLDGEPELKTSPKQQITYKLNSKAVWSDGSPITSADLKYTALQIRDGSDIYDKSGYELIETVDTPNATTAVVTMKEPYAGWRQLFTSLGGVLPSKLLEGKDRNALMKDGYTFSGGPWKLEKWEKGNSLSLVPNTAYWGTKANADKIVFRFIADTAAEFQAFKTGQVDAIYPQPQIDVIDQVKAGLGDGKSIVSTKTGNMEALWLNNAKAPFDSKAVRQAVGYAIDRDAVVNRLFGGIGLTKALNSGLEPELVAKYTDLEAFAEYKLDQKKVDSLMSGDGWAKGSDGIWAKGGNKATFSVQTTAGNKRRELTLAVVQDQLKKAGFDMSIQTQKAADLFGTILPKGDFQMALYAQVLTSLEPGGCTLFCKKNIPTDANKFSGQNWTRTDIPGIEADLAKLDSELNDGNRAAAGKKVAKGLADAATSIPLDPLPTMLLVSNKLVGNFSDNGVLSGFWNLNTWGKKA